MTEYRTYRITNKSPSTDYIRFDLDGNVYFRGGSSQNYIYCVNRFPFDSYSVGDEVEVDLERTRKLGSSDNINDVGAVRLTNYSSSQQLIRKAESDGKATAGSLTGNRYTGEYRKEHVRYDKYTGDYYYEYQEQPPK